MLQVVHEISSVKSIKEFSQINRIKKVEDNYNYQDISYPVACDDIATFEDNNNVMINVWKIEDSGSIYIYMLTAGNSLNCRSGVINLLLITNEEGEGHYIYIYKIGTNASHDNMHFP